MDWDTYFHNICESVASKSPCLSRHIGAILVRDHSIASTGYNGPSRGVPHCGIERLKHDDAFQHTACYSAAAGDDDWGRICPRKKLGFKSGEGMEWCPAQHAEENAISNAARNGVITVDTTLYMNSVIPCQKCFGTLINAGIREVVVDVTDAYDKHTEFLIRHSQICIRRFHEAATILPT